MRKLQISPAICHIASPRLFSKGAYAIHAAEMSKAMRNLGIDFETVLPGPFKTEDIFRFYGIEKPFKVKFLPFTKGFGRQIVHGISASFYAFANRKRFDLVLTRNIVCAALCARIFGLATVYDAHHPPVNGAAELLFKSFRNSPNLKAVSFNSKGLRDLYVKTGLKRSMTVVAHNGADLSAFENLPPSAEIRKRFGLPVGKKIVCYCGNTYAGRGIENLIEVAAEIKDALFLIVGGREKDNLPLSETARAKKVENFSVKGFVPHSQVPLYLAASDVLVMPYTEKMTIKGGTQAAGFTSPLKLFEYMAANRPIVATRLPTVCEVLEDGEDSVLVSPGDARALSEGVKKFLNDEHFARKAAQKARQKAALYTWENRARKIICRASGSPAE